MMGGDDMVMRLRLRHEPTQRERAAEGRKERETETKRNRAKRKVRRARAARVAAARRMTKGRKRKKKGALLRHAGKLKFAAKVGSRVIPGVGWALLVNDAVGLYHDFGRRISGGMSARLVQLRDDYEVYGDMIPRAQASAAALDYVEGDAARLRAIGEDGKMSSTLTSNLEIIERLAYERAVGADMIRRDAHFDSADSFMDKVIMQAEREELKPMADRVAHLLRERVAAGEKGSN